ncbi:MAG: hypothetical protein AVDCRST_MAG70-902, partial [uncultured Thermomicrobiales bacterium]
WPGPRPLVGPSMGGAVWTRSARWPTPMGRMGGYRGGPS